MRLTRFLAVASLVCTALAFPLAASARTITLVADSWPPFNGTPGAEPEGYMVDIARRVFAAAGYTVSYRLLPWKRAVEMTRAGTYDGVFGASRTDADGFIFPDEELGRNKLAFYVSKGNPGKLGCYEGASNFTASNLKTLDYGQTLTQGAITCTSELSGVTCTDTATGHFIRVARESYDLG